MSRGHSTFKGMCAHEYMPCGQIYSRARYILRGSYTVGPCTLRETLDISGHRPSWAHTQRRRDSVAPRVHIHGHTGTHWGHWFSCPLVPPGFLAYVHVFTV